jgi:hypothetical protein
MPIEIQTIAISALVALITTGITCFITWLGIKQQYNSWLFDLKVSYSVELFRTRLTEYSKMFQIMYPLSTKACDALTPDKAKKVAIEINEWFYSTGGLCASARTRDYVWILRNACFAMADGKEQNDLSEEHTKVIWSMRRDLDIKPLEIHKSKDDSPLKGLEAEMKKISS